MQDVEVAVPAAEEVAQPIPEQPKEISPRPQLLIEEDDSSESDELLISSLAYSKSHGDQGKRSVA